LNRMQRKLLPPQLMYTWVRRISLKVQEGRDPQVGWKLGMLGYSLLAHALHTLECTIGVQYSIAPPIKDWPILIVFINSLIKFSVDTLSLAIEPKLT